eukprot:1169657-Heterocapsa_arctica.AAC.2
MLASSHRWSSHHARMLASRCAHEVIGPSVRPVRSIQRGVCRGYQNCSSVELGGSDAVPLAGGGKVGTH